MNSHTPPPDSIDLLSQDGLRAKDLAEKYPWCAAAQLSALLAFKKNNDAQFDKQAGKTALFFTNTLWLNWQLHVRSGNAGIVTVGETEATAENTVTGEQVLQNKVERASIPGNPLTSGSVAGELPAFEPLHTTDYFASQGIKLTDEPVSQDKLGTQMKSFTEWLKSMKRLHKDSLPPGDVQTDKAIQQIAEHSNEAGEVVTEAMAEVLLKQDKIEKAIAVYRKLSLINPSKSAYFAAKIDSLSTGGQP